MVRAVGIEPTLLAEPDFESGASTSSTTPAAFASSHKFPLSTRGSSADPRPYAHRHSIEPTLLNVVHKRTYTPFK